MVLFTLRLPPLLAGLLISFLTTSVMTTRPRTPAGTAPWPTVAQQQADAIEDLLTDGAGNIDTEVILHVTSDGNTLDDGTPLADSVAAGLIPHSFIRALIHNAHGNPIDATNRRRHPTTRQRRLVKARDKNCTDCGRDQLLEYDHVPPYEQTGHTLTAELELRCALCHQIRTARR